MSKNRNKKGKNSPQINSKISLFLWIMGYSQLEIPRAFLEDFLNICLRYGFDYYCVSVDEEKRKVTLFVPLFQTKNILTACRMWQIRVKLTARFGLPEKLSAYRGRWGLLVGVILATVLFALSQSVIWRIDVMGNSRLSRSDVIDSLNQNGLRIGSRISSLNTDSIEQKMMINDDNIAWMSINISGTVASVEIREVIDTEIKEKNTSPANLISRFDAQIVGMEVYSGFLSVKEGDFVRKGDLLVSGIYKEGKAPLRISRASGRILGRISHTFEVEVPLVQSKKVYSGEKISKKTLNFFGNSIKLFTNYRNLPLMCDIINYVYMFNPLNLGELPISLSVDTYLPYEYKEVEINENEAIEQAYEILREKMDEELPDAQILRKKLSGEFVDGKYILKCTVVAICDIARQVDFQVVN